MSTAVVEESNFLEIPPISTSHRNKQREYTLMPFLLGKHQIQAVSRVQGPARWALRDLYSILGFQLCVCLHVIAKNRHVPKHGAKFITNFALFMVHKLKIMMGLLLQTFKAVCVSLCLFVDRAESRSPFKFLLSVLYKSPTKANWIATSQGDSTILWQKVIRNRTQWVVVSGLKRPGFKLPLFSHVLATHSFSQPILLPRVTVSNLEEEHNECLIECVCGS